MAAGPRDLPTPADSAARELHRLLAAHRRMAVFTGAGVSTESGIPDFRSPGGIWTRYDPRQFTFQRYVESAEVRALAWRMRREFFAAAPAPNAAHKAIAALELAGRSPGVVTQNIDGLHAAAGSRTVVELHGTARDVICIGRAPRHGRPEGCGFRVATTWVFEALDRGEEDPACPRCGGLLKSATISFGQAMDEDAMVAAHELITGGDAVLVVGSSLQVHPAAAVPELALEHGLPLAIVNAEPTPLDEVADVVVHGRAGEVLGPVVAAVLEG